MATTLYLLPQSLVLPGAQLVFSCQSSCINFHMGPPVLKRDINFMSSLVKSVSKLAILKNKKLSGALKMDTVCQFGCTWPVV